MSDSLKPDSPADKSSSVDVQLDGDNLNSLLESMDGGLSPEAEGMLIQTAMRTILFQIVANYRDELHTLLGEDKFDDDGNIIALTESEIPVELFEFICDKIMGYVPKIEIEIINNEENE